LGAQWNIAAFRPKCGRIVDFHIQQIRRRAAAFDCQAGGISVSCCLGALCPAKVPLMSHSRIGHALLLTRPYSWIDAALNVVVGLAYAGVHARGHGLAAIVGLCVWASLNWISERVQRDPGRTPVSWPLALGPLVLAGVIAHLIGGSATHTPLLLLGFFLFLYPMKARSRYIGPFGPVIRGIHTAMIVALGVSMSGQSDVAWALLLALGLAQVARSLIGDIRDHLTDKYELPKLIGITPAKAVGIALLLASVVAFHSAAVHPLVLALALIQAIVVACIPVQHGYLLHVFLVASSVAIKLGLYWSLAGLSGVGLLALVVVQIGLLRTYRMVPRPANQAWLAWLRTLRRSGAWTT
jgi:hypothetical protein